MGKLSEKMTNKILIRKICNLLKFNRFWKFWINFNGLGGHLEFLTFKFFKNFKFFKISLIKIPSQNYFKLPNKTWITKFLKVNRNFSPNQLETFSSSFELFRIEIKQNFLSHAHGQKVKNIRLKSRDERTFSQIKGTRGVLHR